MDCIEFLEKKSLKINDLNRKFITHVEDKRFSIIMNSEDTDICKSYALYLLYWITREENENKTVYIISHNYHQALLIKKELVEMSKKIFLGIETDSEKYVKYKNGVKVKFYKLHKHIDFAETVHLAICIDVAEVQNYIFLNFYKAFFPSLSAHKDSKLIINSQPNGMNLFNKLFTDAEEGINSMSALRLYYWEDGKKDGAWVRDKINSIGEEEFNRRYNLQFYALKYDRKDIDI
jgi:hypothetical protein